MNRKDSATQRTLCCNGSLTADSTAVYYAGGLATVNASGTATGNYAALVAEIAPTQTTPISIDEITQFSPLVPAASRLPSAVAPGEIVRILGRGIGPQNQAGAKLTASGTLATSIGGVQVTFNGVPAPLVTAQANEVVAITPFELNGLTSAAVQVQYNGLTSNTYTFRLSRRIRIFWRWRIPTGRRTRHRIRRRAQWQSS